MRRYLEAVEAMEERFIEVNPEAADNLDVRRGKVQLLARTLFRMTMRSRRASLAVFIRMLRADPRTALHQFPKYAAVGLLGSQARNVLRQRRLRGQRQRT
jgi:hypothetical protein